MSPEALQSELQTRSLTPSEAAGVLGIARSTLYRYLTGETAIPAHRADSIRVRLAHWDNATA